MSTSHVILCINCGSSSLKFALYQPADDEQLVAGGEVDRIGIPGTSIKVRDGSGATLRDGPFEFSRLDEIVGAIFAGLEQLHIPQPIAVGHRIVHGGPDHTAPEQVTPEVLTALRKDYPVSGYVFTSERGTPFTTDAINRLVKIIGRRAGLAMPVHFLISTCCAILAGISSPTTASTPVPSRTGWRCVDHAYHALHSVKPDQVQGFLEIRANSDIGERDHERHPVWDTPIPCQRYHHWHWVSLP